MSMNLEMSKVFEWHAYFERAGSQDVDAALVLQLYEEAKNYLTEFQWCAALVEEYVGFIFPRIVGVFLFRISPARQGIDEWVWVIVGDLPPAYITCEDSPNPATALDSYIGAMLEWIKAIDENQSTDGLIPVNVPATKANAERLSARLKFLDDKILAGYADDLKA
jgi:hypothetical protein